MNYGVRSDFNGMIGNRTYNQSYKSFPVNFQTFVSWFAASDPPLTALDKLSLPANRSKNIYFM